MRRLVLAILAAAAIQQGLYEAARAADPRFPDWPCNQIKVPEVSIAAVWAGPAIDDVRDAWETDAQLKDLVDRLAARRTPIEDAEKLIAGYLTGSSAEKEDKARRLFAGVFDTLNRQRSEVMRGIERFARRQKDLAGRIRSEAIELRTQQDAASRDPGKLDEIADRIAWETRIFEDRRKSIGYVCEVPVIIERRLFALGRAIQQSLD